ncbi:MAG: FAD-dependent oxidoreductase [Candidatus Giovannonibacteria bacterium]|nr:MAG: FAD-dependent oxidoreductase [Candidatus Giovannonibacteria bacterium]
MEKADYLILGGGIAGTAAAEALREADQHAKIVILEDEPHVLYSRVMIPKYIKGLVPRENLFLRKIGDYEKRALDFYPSTRAVKIDFARKEVKAETGLAVSYKRILIASGGRPRPLPEPFLSAAASAKILRMHTLKDADLIKKELESGAHQSALVAGESFIALEFIEILSLAGVRVHIAAKGDIWGEERFGKACGELLEENFKKHGIIIHKNIEDFLFKTSLACLGIGLSRDLSIFPGLEVGRGVLADEFLKTSDKDAFAAGDIAEFFDVVLGKKRIVGNWTNAFLQGKTAALNMAGGGKIFRAVPAYNISNLGLRLSALGDTEDFDEEKIIPGDNNCARLLFSAGKLAGATLINRFNDKIILSELIEKGANRDETSKIFS